MPKKYKLGFGNGAIIEHEDGTAAWRASGSLTEAFRVRIADVTGFSVSKNGKLLERQLSVLGNGTLLGTAPVNHGTAELIERWFRSHAAFGSRTEVPRANADGTASIADEIAKFAKLRDSGALSEEEFAAAKARLLDR